VGISRESILIKKKLRDPKSTREQSSPKQTLNQSVLRYYITIQKSRGKHMNIAAFLVLGASRRVTSRTSTFLTSLRERERERMHG
jgi:hypothetical protein